MNAGEIRYKLFKALSSEDETRSVTRVSPVPGKPLELEAVVADRYAGTPGKVRKYRITIEEID
jgi:hypothetical protein